MAKQGGPAEAGAVETPLQVLDRLEQLTLKRRREIALALANGGSGAMVDTLPNVQRLLETIAAAKADERVRAGA
jgi:hypothetical protein